MHCSVISMVWALGSVRSAGLHMLCLACFLPAASVRHCAKEKHAGDGDMTLKAEAKLEGNG